MSKRLYAIDLIRFTAALAVMLYHYLFRGWKADNMSMLNFEKYGHLFKYGYLGVDVFFIISGFVIFLSIQKFSIYSFIKSRITRLYPAYWLCVLITFVVCYLYGNEVYMVNIKQLLANLTMMNGFIGIKHIDGVYWTLLIEIKFYLLILLYLLLIKFFNISKNIDYFNYAWLGISITYALFNCMEYTDIFILKITKHVFILKYSHYFIAGSIFFSIYKRGFSLKYIFPLLTSFILALIWSFKKMIIFEHKYLIDYSFYFISVIIGLSYVFFLLLVTQKLNFLNNAKFLKLGALTYPLYLLHQNVGFVFFNNAYPFYDKYLLLIFTIILMLLASYMIHKFVEQSLGLYLKKKLDHLYNLYVTKK